MYRLRVHRRSKEHECQKKSELAHGWADLDIVIDESGGTALMLVHSSELSQAEANGHGVAQLHLHANRLPCHGCVVLLQG